jgi:hypothetical protein
MKVFVSGLVLVMMCVSAAQAAVLEIQDTTVNGDGTNVQDAGTRAGTSQDLNYGVSPIWNIRGVVNVEDGGERGVLSWFDISSIPAGQTVDSATLTLRIRCTYAIPSYAEVGRVLEPWGAGALLCNEGLSDNAVNPGEITWNNREHDTVPWTDPGLQQNGGVGASRDMGFAIDVAVNDGNWFVSVDVKDIVATWVEDGDPNYGFILNHTLPSGTSGWEVSMSEDIAERRPKLVINYTPEPASLVLVGLGGVALLRRRR